MHGNVEVALEGAIPALLKVSTANMVRVLNNRRPMLKAVSVVEVVVLGALPVSKEAAERGEVNRKYVVKRKMRRGRLEMGEGSQEYAEVGAN